MLGYSNARGERVEHLQSPVVRVLNHALAQRPRNPDHAARAENAGEYARIGTDRSEPPPTTQKLLRFRHAPRTPACLTDGVVLVSTPVPPNSLRRRRGAALLLSALVIAFGCFVTGMYAFAGAPWLGPLLAWAALAAAIAGVVLLLVSTGAERAADGAVPQRGRMLGRGRRALLGAAASVVLLLVVALGVMDGLVWMPEALVPGMSASEIRERMDAAGELGSALTALGLWAGIWATVALVPAMVGALPIGERIMPDVRGVLFLGCAIAAAAIFFQWMGTFSMGMGVADTFGVSGGQSPFWAFYSLFGQTALIGFIVLELWPFTRGVPAPAPA